MLLVLTSFPCIRTIVTCGKLESSRVEKFKIWGIGTCFIDVLLFFSLDFPFFEHVLHVKVHVRRFDVSLSAWNFLLVKVVLRVLSPAGFEVG